MPIAKILRKLFCDLDCMLSNAHVRLVSCGGMMKKFIYVLAAAIILVGFLSSAHATPVQILSTNLVSGLRVHLDGANRTLHAGEFQFILNPGTANQKNTISYCGDPRQYFRSGAIYDHHFEILPVANYLADDRINENMPQAAYLMNKFAVAFNGALDGFTARDTAGGLQLAIWKKLFPSIVVKDHQAHNIRGAYDHIIEHMGSLTDGYFLAWSNSKQDQIFRVSEPATMMLLGVGLLGLCIVNRRRIKV